MERELRRSEREIPAVRLIVDALAVYRGTRLVVDDVIFARIRDQIFEKYPPTPNSWSYVLTCRLCSSVWVAGVLLGLKRISPRLGDSMSLLLALSAVTVLITEYEERRV